ncbi:hypothetical protein [Alkalibacterium pelagium]|uniref:Uncharacterized protein n=1 Tax=Alkalibacterium pelagium TaxID=426702 RepID=A0A1H7IME2_9LACT|nr:hypothetical protein [Alkalibacterium pelagium]GEN50089.1 hypothetical protein APE02nite_07540 [Alkalibacterium pelagium]SEK61905.1 hypothetical protein SAMN04488099_104136 [Alkalibacterium pelagium]
MADIDQKKTRENSQNVLKRYKQLQRIAPTKEELEYYGRQHFSELSLSCLEELTAIRVAVEKVNSKSRQIIEQRYITLEISHKSEQKDKLGYSQTIYSKTWIKGEIEFAQYYRDGELLVYED